MISKLILNTTYRFLFILILERVIVKQGLHCEALIEYDLLHRRLPCPCINLFIAYSMKLLDKVFTSHPVDGNSGLILDLLGPAVHDVKLKVDFLLKHVFCCTHFIDC